MQINPQDPLLDAPKTERDLWMEVGKVTSGYPAEIVMSIGINIVIDTIRQLRPTQKTALDAFDEVMGRVRSRLAEHYGNNGVRKNIFPFDQIIKGEFVDFSKDRKW
jgi:hypothetical protein